MARRGDIFFVSLRLFSLEIKVAQKQSSENSRAPVP